MLRVGVGHTEVTAESVEELIAMLQRVRQDANCWREDAYQHSPEVKLTVATDAARRQLHEVWERMGQLFCTE
jgi:hypothetical protein